MAGALGAILADKCIGAGLDLPDLPESLQAVLRGGIPDYGMVGNPVDVTGAGDDGRDRRGGGLCAGLHAGPHGGRAGRGFAPARALVRRDRYRPGAKPRRLARGGSRRVRRPGASRVRSGAVPAVVRSARRQAHRAAAAPGRGARAGAALQ
ncbi:hypothetical protein G6F62_013851 [Rhizopus arrhizus]|nr:hypothetical protein G6F62_013851 [Rhizopus arrhizus]